MFQISREVQRFTRIFTHVLPLNSLELSDFADDTCLINYERFLGGLI